MQRPLTKSPAARREDTAPDEPDAAPDALPPEGWPTEQWPPADVIWLPEAYYNAALWETT